MALQTTLREPVACTGVGLHCGLPVRLRLLAAPADTGIVFRRTDMERKGVLIPARYDLVTQTRLGTTLRNAHGATVATVEHLMAALWGAGVDNAVVELDAPEVPIMDGSSEPFLALLAEAGLRRLPVPRKVIRVLRDVEVNEGESSARVAPYEGDEYGCQLEVEIDFRHPLVACQRALYDFGTETFTQALAKARTFGFAHEVAALRAQGLALGGSLENAVVVGDEGVLNAEGLRYPDEFIRHKALDCLGDLYLAGHRIEGAFGFVRPGHSVNNKLLRALLADREAWKLVSTAQPVMQTQPQPQQAIRAFL